MSNHLGGAHVIATRGKKRETKGGAGAPRLSHSRDLPALLLSRNKQHRAPPLMGALIPATRRGRAVAVSAALAVSLVYKWRAEAQRQAAAAAAR